MNKDIINRCEELIIIREESFKPFCEIVETIPHKNKLKLLDYLESYKDYLKQQIKNTKSKYHREYLKIKLRQIKELKFIFLDNL